MKLFYIFESSKELEDMAFFYGSGSNLRCNIDKINYLYGWVKKKKINFIVSFKTTYDIL